MVALALHLVRFAVAWGALKGEGSTAAFGAVVALGSAAEVLSYLLLSWVGDAYERRRVVIWCNALTVAAMLLFGVAQVVGEHFLWVAAMAMVLLSVSSALRGSVQQSMLADVVSSDRLSAAIRLKTTLMTLAGFLGPFLGAGAVTFIGVSGATVLAAVLGIGGACLMSQVKVDSPPHSSVGAGAAGGLLKRAVVDASQGMLALYRVKVEFWLGVLAMATNLALYPFLSFLLLSLLKERSAAPWLFGVVDGAFGVGLFLGASLFVELLNRRMGRRNVMALGFALLGLPMLGAGVVQPVLERFLFVSTTASFLLLVPVFLLAGCGLMFINVNSTLVRSLASPKAFQARLFGAAAFLAGIAMPLGSALASALTLVVPLPSVIAILGAVAVLCAPLCLLIPELRSVMDMSDERLDKEYLRRYPGAFGQPDLS